MLWCLLKSLKVSKEYTVSFCIDYHFKQSRAN